MATCAWSSLPDEVWQLILQNVPLQDRLGPCSRVCTKLYKAAATATNQLQLTVDSAQRSQGFKDWLQRHGEVLHSLHLDLRDAVGVLAELPCQHLRQLHLSFGNNGVQLGASSSQPGILSGCPGLTQLEVLACSVRDAADAVAALAAAVPTLQHLVLAEVRSLQEDPVDPDMLQSDPDVFMLPADVLQKLTQLTSLALDSSVRVSAASFEHISNLQHLQELHLWRPYGSDLELSPSSTPGLSQVTALQSLVLEWANLDPAVLCGCTQLQRLMLRLGSVLDGPAALPLLSFIGRQQHLQQLELADVSFTWPAAAAAYTALTASSKLQWLEFGFELTPTAIPAGLWQAVFRPAQQLPSLTYVCIYPCVDSDTAAMSAADITALVSVCPGLERLSLPPQPDVQLAALSQLTALTSISLYGATAASWQSLAAVARLRQLLITSCPDLRLDTVTLLPLTALQRLTRLDAADDGYINHMTLTDMAADADDEPDVWRQLLELCEEAAAEGGSNSNSSNSAGGGG